MGPLGGTKAMAGRGGLEPPLRGPEPRVLPLDDLPAFLRFYAATLATVKAWASERERGLEDGPLERAARLEARHAAGRDLDGLARPGIPPVALGAPGDHEGAEAADGHPPAFDQGAEDAVQERVEGALRGHLRSSRGLRHGRHEVCLRHGSSYLLERGGRSQGAANQAVTRSTACSRACAVNGFSRTCACESSRNSHAAGLAVSPVMKTNRAARSRRSAIAA